MVAPGKLAGGHCGRRGKRHSLGPVASRQPVRMASPPGFTNGDRRLGEHYCAVGVADSTNVNQGVLEGMEDVTVGRSRGELREYKSARRGGVMYVFGGSSGADCWNIRVDVGARCTLGQVDATVATVEYSSVEESKWGKEGGASRGGARGVCRFGKIISVNQIINFTNYMSYPTLSGVPADMVLASAHGVGAGSFLIMSWTGIGACGAGVGFTKAEPVGMAVGANSGAARVGLGESSPQARTPPGAGGRNSVKFVA